MIDDGPVFWRRRRRFAWVWFAPSNHRRGYGWAPIVFQFRAPMLWPSAGIGSGASLAGGLARLVGRRMGAAPCAVDREPRRRATGARPIPSGARRWMWCENAMEVS